MINGEYRNQNNTLSSDDDSFNVSNLLLFTHVVSADQKVPIKNVRWHLPEPAYNANTVPPPWNGRRNQPQRKYIQQSQADHKEEGV